MKYILAIFCLIGVVMAIDPYTDQGTDTVLYNRTNKNVRPNGANQIFNNLGATNLTIESNIVVGETVTIGRTNDPTAGAMDLGTTNFVLIVRLTINTNGDFVMSDGTNTMMVLKKSSGTDNSTNKFLAADGHYYIVSSGGGVNPSPFYLPFNNSGTFDDSPLYVVTGSPNRIGFNSSTPFINKYGLSIGIGENALDNQTASTSTALGHQALTAATAFASGQTAVGDAALLRLTDGSNNEAFGIAALEHLINGSFNVAVGSGSLDLSTGGQENTAVGFHSGYTNTVGTENVFIGYLANPLSGTDNNSIVIGAEAVGHGDNTMTLGNTNITGVYLPFGGVMQPVTVGSADSGGTGFKLLRIPN